MLNILKNVENDSFVRDKKRSEINHFLYYLEIYKPKGGFCHGSE